MSGFKTISIHGLDDIDQNIIRSAVETHFDKIDVLDHQNVDFTLTQDLMPSAPYKIGQILDLIEQMLFKARTSNIISYDIYELDWEKSTMSISTQSYNLSDRERDLLAELIQAGDKGCDREFLLRKIWGYQSNLETHALETQIYRLRQKIEKEPDNPKYLVTIDNGYKLAI